MACAAQVEDAYVHLHLDAYHKGLGGDDSWSPAHLRQYRIAPGTFNFSVRIRALTPELGLSVEDVYRTTLPRA